eukprot:CAMPEP_0172500706 /NCGR_PEP_ID=MMETSP1066-20121228/142154_1 /TAXON_ID=671091 /ORGANISM="Coscinodiscus wailesii, Strain CCMP2513" /LENGTH=45 /DNA_ID= /DNA_START= /DNA_END= /DNA_ORIENTATION=
MAYLLAAIPVKSIVTIPDNPNTSAKKNGRYMTKTYNDNSNKGVER